MNAKLNRHFANNKALWLMGALWLAPVFWAFLNGPGWYAKETQDMATEVELQTRNVCQRLKMPFGSIDFAACASALNDARQLGDEQNQRRAVGIL
jgi:hypothetical protein